MAFVPYWVLIEQGNMNLAELQTERQAWRELPRRKGFVNVYPVLYERWWSLSAGAIVLAGLILRLYELPLKPLHHDEGVNGYFLLGLFRNGFYRYDPANYHGPSLYYFALITSSVNNLIFGVEGPTTNAIRAVPALFGIGCVALVLALRQRLGWLGTLAAAAFVAISPGMVYVSRDFIHEMLLLFFTLSMVVCGMWFWDTGRPRHLMLASVAAALMFATKETAVISGLALACGLVLAAVRAPSQCVAKAKHWGAWPHLIFLLLLAVVLFFAGSFLLFSSFFGNSHGIHDAFATFSYWGRTGITRQTAPWYTYVEWLWRDEAVILLLGLLGAVVGVVKRNRFITFTVTWAFSLLLGYSILPYKTPWILIDILLPLCLAAGYLTQQLWDTRAFLVGNAWARYVSLGLILISLGFCAYRSLWLNFFHYDDWRSAYPYVQTFRGFAGLASRVDRFATTSGSGVATSIVVTAPEYWPLPWYLKDYRNVGYFGRIVPTEAPVVIGSGRQERQLALLLGTRYRLASRYPLRPGVDLVLFLAKK